MRRSDDNPVRLATTALIECDDLRDRLNGIWRRMLFSAQSDQIDDRGHDATPESEANDGNPE